jgi:quercetin dioxygenase-like cupin family protein
MKKIIVLVLFFASILLANRSFGQDLCKTNPKYVKLLSDTGGIKMMLVTLPPGAKLVTHTHPLNFGYVLKGGLYKWTYNDGKTVSYDMKVGEDFHGGTERPHHSWNAGKTTIQFILLEKYK